MRNVFEGFPWKKNGAYCWCTKSCTTKDDDYPIIYRILTIPFWVGVIFHDPFCLFKWMLGVLVLGVDETSTILAVSWSQCCSMGLEWPWILLRILYFCSVKYHIYRYSDIPKLEHWGIQDSNVFFCFFWFILVAFETTKDSISELACRASNWNEPYAIMNLHGTNGAYHEANQLTNYIYICYLSCTPKYSYIQCFLSGNWVCHRSRASYLFADVLVGWFLNKFQRYNYPNRWFNMI